jgi:hypothetical protein
MADVGAWLQKVVLGYYQYHAVPGNTTHWRLVRERDMDKKRGMDPPVRLLEVSTGRRGELRSEDADVVQSNGQRTEIQSAPKIGYWFHFM